MPGGPFTATAEDLAVPCPHCKQPPLQRCKGPFGPTKTHQARKRAAAKEAA